MFDEPDQDCADPRGVDVTRLEHGPAEPAGELHALRVGEVLDPAHHLAGPHGGSPRAPPHTTRSARQNDPARIPVTRLSVTWCSSPGQCSSVAASTEWP